MISEETLKLNEWKCLSKEFPQIWKYNGDDECQHNCHIQQNEYDGTWTYRDSRNVVYGVETWEELTKIMTFCSKTFEPLSK